MDLVFSDLHLHNYSKFGFDDTAKITVRLKEQSGVLKQILDIVDEKKVKRVFFGGDWFHKDKEIPTECLAITKWFFDNLKNRGVIFYAVRGNHDLVLKDSANPVHYTLGAFDIVNKSPEGVYFGHYDQEIDVETVKGYDLVIIHRTPIGCELHKHIFSEGMDWKTLSKNNRNVMFGHIHEYQELAWNCVVIGPPLHLTFGDKGPRGVFIRKNGDLHFEFVPLKYPQFLTVDTADQATDKYNYYRVLSGGDSSIDGRVVCIKKPTYHEARIKSRDFIDIIKEWLVLQGKDQSYLGLIESLVQQEVFTSKTIPNLKLKSVDIKNFLSFKKGTFDVQMGFNLVEGITDEYSSNGSGKSSLMEAIFWCLFGETTKGLTGDSIIRKYPEQQKDCQVTLQLESDKLNTVVLCRTRKAGLSICVNDKVVTEGMKQKECQEYLERMLGFDKNIFISSTYFNQEQLLLLTRLGQSDTNNMITDLLGFSKYDHLSDVVSDWIKVRERILIEYTDKDNKLTSRNAWLTEGINKSTAKAAEMIERAEGVKEDGIKIKLQIFEIEKEFMETEAPTVDTSELDKEEVDLNEQVEHFDWKVGEKQRAVDAIDLQDVNTSIFQARTRIGHFDKELEKSEAEVSNLNKPSNKVCSHCGMTMTDVHKEQLIHRLTVGMEEIRNSRDREAKSLEVYRSILQDKEKAKLSLSKELSEFRSRKENANKQLIDLGKRKQQALIAVTERQQKELKLHSLRDKLGIYKDSFDQLKEDFEEIKAQVNRDKSEIAENNAELLLNKVNSNEISEEKEKLVFWKEAFSYKGIRSLLLDGFCNEINGILSEYMAMISNGAIQVEFSPTSLTKKGEERNRLDLVITRGDTQQEYASLSGGEKRRVDCAVCLAFSKWVQNFYGLKTSLLGILICDELFTGVDEAGESAIEDVLVNESRNKALFVISHGKYTGSRANHIITVQKRNRVSEVWV